MARRDLSFFSRWFDRLARTPEFRAALLPICGMSLGNFLVLFGATVPHHFGWYVALLGLVLLGSSILLFLVFAVLYMWRNS